MAAIPPGADGSASPRWSNAVRCTVSERSGDAAGRGGGERAGSGRCHRVPHRPELQGDQIVQLVASVGSCRQTQPPPRGDLAYGVLERRRWNVVAFIDDHQPVGRGQLGQIVSPRQGLQHRHIDRAPHLGSTSAELTDGHAEVLLHTRPPLVSQRPAVDEDQRRGRVVGDRRARDDGLPSAGRSDEHSELVIDEGGDRRCLLVT